MEISFLSLSFGLGYGQSIEPSTSNHSSIQNRDGDVQTKSLSTLSSKKAQPNPAPLYQVTQGYQKVKILKWGPSCGVKPKNQTFRKSDRYSWNGRFLVPTQVKTPLLFHPQSCHAISQQFYLQESFPSKTLIECTTPPDYSKHVYGTLHLIQNARKEPLAVHHSFKYTWTFKGDSCDLVLNVQWNLKEVNSPKLSSHPKKKESLSSLNKATQEKPKIEEIQLVIEDSSSFSSFDKGDSWAQNKTHIPTLPLQASLKATSSQNKEKVDEPFSPSFYSQLIISPSPSKTKTPMLIHPQSAHQTQSSKHLSKQHTAYSKSFKWSFFVLALLMGLGPIWILRRSLSRS